MKRINSHSFDVDLGGEAIHVDSMTLDITDNTAPAKKGGRPDGWLQGDVEASGEISVGIVEAKKIIQLAKDKGSFQDMDAFDINTFAKAGDDEFKVEAFGCKLKLASLLNIDKSYTDKSMINIPFDVTGPEFIKIDGIPYISPSTEQTT